MPNSPPSWSIDPYTGPWGEGFGPGKRKREGKGDLGRFLGWAEREKEEGEMFCIFLRRNKHIQLKFKFKEFKFKLKPKQIDNALQHECKTNQTTSINFGKFTNIYFLLH